MIDEESFPSDNKHKKQLKVEIKKQAQIQQLTNSSVKFKKKKNADDEVQDNPI